MWLLCRSLAGAVCIGIGVLLAEVSGFLSLWEYAAKGESDIVARGGIVLYLILPWIVGIGWVVVAAIAARPLRRAGFSWWVVSAISLVAGVVAAVLVLVPPIFLAARVLAPLPGALRPIADFVLAGLLVVVGLAVVRRGQTVPRTATLV